MPPKAMEFTHAQTRRDEKASYAMVLDTASPVSAIEGTQALVKASNAQSSINHYLNPKVLKAAGYTLKNGVCRKTVNMPNKL